ncbi:MAG: TatD family hydrolase [Lachnospiraceae bacterium]|nr:TatD family hydrolase [Lachnospiraceae bacterium]
MSPIFDTHAHYDDPAFAPDRSAVIGALQTAGIAAVVDIGAGIETSRKAQALAREYDFFYCALGSHPTEIRDLTEENLRWLEEQVRQDPKCVAVGEIGLDYHWKDTTREEQRSAFELQLDLARRCEKPVVIHSRDAAADTLAVLKEQHAEEIGGVIHCYSYSREMAAEFLKLDFYFGIGGVLTFANSVKLKETAEFLPLERIVLETDCPYLAPAPHRGKRNSSLNLPLVVAELARIKQISEEEVRRITWENAHRLYRLPSLV